jgi:asparagine synthetase A
VIRKGGIRMSEEIVLEAFKPYIGKHCETTALKRVLDYHELSLSEEMPLGLGGGISLIYPGT